MMTHFYAVGPGRCRYLGSVVNSQADDDAFRRQLAPGEQLLRFTGQDSAAIRIEALKAARALITPDLLAWHGGERVRELRDAQGLSQATISEVTGLTANWLSRIENNLIPNPEFASLQRLTLALGCSLRDLL